ncbi:MAG: methyltransferase domain-containing protein [Candidatus Omnitrophota bacterium]
MDTKIYEKIISGDGTADIYKDESFARNYDASAAAIFGKSMAHYNADIDFLLNLTTFSPRDFIVDLGCGTGIATQRLLERNSRRIIGVDSSEAMLQHAREKLPDVEFTTASAEELSDVVSDADKIVSTHVFQYISDPGKVLTEIYKALSPNGEYLFNVMVKTPNEPIYRHVFRVLEAAIDDELGKKIKLPELKGFEPKYDRAAIEAMARRPGFVLARYEEKPVVHAEEHVRAIHEQLLTAAEIMMAATSSGEPTKRMLRNARERLHNLDFSHVVAGKEAYVCLRKPC